MAPKGKQPSAEDRALFEAAVGDAKPLGKSKPQAREETQAEPAKRPAKLPPPASVKAMPALSAGTVAGVDKRTATRLKRGRMPPQARLDLHGHTLDQAHGAVRSFINRAAAEGLRSVIIITGKGKLSGDRRTIRGELSHWLNRPDLRPRILVFSEAQPKDGGAGAFYVLLRKKS